MSSPSLSSLGWDDSWAEAFAPYDGMVPGRVARVDRGRCDVLTRHGEVQAAWRGDPPCAGDWVALRGGRVGAILPRRTSFVRGGVARQSRGGLSGDSQSQVLAANVDVAFIVEPAVPDASQGRIERLLALAWQSGATPYVVITKADLANDLPYLIEAVKAAAPGVDVHAVSAMTGDGLDAVRALATGTSVLLGPSGAGKSTLVNALAGQQVMRTQEIRASDGRGRHTTTHRELVAVPGGLIIDTPGVRRVGLYDVDEGLAQAFSDVEDLAAECRFSDCAHETEPGCAVLLAVESGDLPERRLTGWRRLRREAEWIASRTDARLRSERLRERKLIHRQARRDRSH
ncbi:ribosome small subunit-dependent GTPase A [Actinomadura sp. DC4]|uniref:ribosome small subunit-dependent GTPase A n=1 Tax=Actinomadura sp. DC4 TaxID=3055069 RepID=UPI0025AF846E|nr:ribosome small subunit-dependent GTPase A [Actinomadura sp. DC4]MDN3355166.1 ribosome small subunit-dependent GTPase A [Actinomadura sp. DC4]